MHSDESPTSRVPKQFGALLDAPSHPTGVKKMKSQPKKPPSMAQVLRWNGPTAWWRNRPARVPEREWARFITNNPARSFIQSDLQDVIDSGENCKQARDHLAFLKRYNLGVKR
jgi:hypothetical protein